MGTAEVMALVRAKAGKGFSGTARPVDGSFRAVPIDRMARLEAAAVEAVEAEVVVDDMAEVVPPAPTVEELLAEAREAGFAAGRADGLAEGRKLGALDTEAGVIAARDAFVALASKLAVTGMDGADALSAALSGAVRSMASVRAGQVIDDLPAPFLARIEILADRVAQGVRAVTVALHPEDLAAVAPYLAGSDLAGAVVAADPRLSRGDVAVRAEGISLTDLIGVAP
ncbi:flagellar assembly protein FliH [Gemmobacter aquarius]|uniref:Flagellar assembly protein FliH n=2 Tax=Paragemmobacter aquarius TaxID=2169400 RepID=A0A2S0UPC9_9RHOB|nr:flagellar assembly protein FliH [Gemmobacter aquarius]